jgi:hypothetical protein
MFYDNFIPSETITSRLCRDSREAVSDPGLVAVVLWVGTVKESPCRTDSSEKGVGRVLTVQQPLFGGTGCKHVLQEFVVALGSCYSIMVTLYKNKRPR